MLIIATVLRLFLDIGEDCKLTEALGVVITPALEPKELTACLLYILIEGACYQKISEIAFKFLFINY